MNPVPNAVGAGQGRSRPIDDFTGPGNNLHRAEYLLLRTFNTLMHRGNEKTAFVLLYPIKGHLTGPELLNAHIGTPP